jgi:hypothetical protein
LLSNCALKSTLPQLNRHETAFAIGT